MRSIQAALADYRDAARAFSPPARRFLASTVLTWTGHGISNVVFNLYLDSAGMRESFIGQAISLNALGLATMALPAGLLADRWGRRPCLVVGAVLDGAAMLARATVSAPEVVLGASFAAGVGQSLIAIAAAPYLAEHSRERERTHLFTAFFASSLLAGVVGSVLGGWLPALLSALPIGRMDGLFGAYRATLVAGAVLTACGAIPLARSSISDREQPQASESVSPEATRRLIPIALNSLLIGAGAGLVIPFMNLYFAIRFDCSSAQIGMFFSVAQLLAAFAALVGPALARRFGKLRTATTAQLLSLPFLVTLAAERTLEIAVGAYWIRATLMLAATPLMSAFVMESLPRPLQARSASLSNLVWNIGWAGSAALSGWIIEGFGYAVPFYITATLYATAALLFYRSFRGIPEGSRDPRPAEELKGARGIGAPTE